MNVQDKITLEVHTQYGLVEVEFVIIAIISTHRYLLLSQDRIVLGEQLANTNWQLSTPIEVLNMYPIKRITHKQVNPQLCQH